MSTLLAQSLEAFPAGYALEREIGRGGLATVFLAHLLVRSDLICELRVLIAKRGLTQKAAAKALGVTQPRVSDLVHGRIELLSIDRLPKCGRASTSPSP
jgi:DNA-binding Xre family transcriptional regulator